MRNVSISALALSAAVSAAIMVGSAGTASALDNVAATKHNLSTTGTFTYHADGTTGGTADVCVFCHTPHGADTTVGVVLWNRAINSSGYTMYSSDTISGAIAAQPEGVSLACLSCHDGTLAFDQLVNGPGPGDYDPAATSRGWSFAGGVDLSGAGITNISQDLSNDHPVSIAVDGSDAAIETPGNITGAGLNLYTGTNPNQVECASCHNPHSVDFPPFLRVSNAASALCTSCHLK